MKIMNRKNIFFSVLGLLVLSAFFVTGMIYNENNGSTNSAQELGYHGSVVISVNDEVVDSGSNVLYNTGAEAIEVSLGTGSADAFDWIELGDADLAAETPDAAKTEAYTAHDADGLSVAEGTVASNGNGNWSIWKTFESTAASQDMNVTRLQNAAGVDLAGKAFTHVTLEDGDAVTINWTIWVS